MQILKLSKANFQIRSAYKSFQKPLQESKL